jgi:hypothetical protein
VFDLHYARRQGLSLDLRILLCTALKLFGLPATALRSLVPVRGETAEVEQSPRRLAA